MPSCTSSLFDRVLNALMREWDGWQAAEDKQSGASGIRFVFAEAGTAVFAPLLHRSAVGYHKFDGRLWLEGAPRREIGFSALLGLLLREPAIAGRSSETSRLNFLRRAAASAGALAEVAEARGAERPFRAGDPKFIAAESALRFGHAVHPTPLSREEFSAEEFRRFGHEFGADFRLRWWRVHRDQLAAGAVAGHEVPAMVRELAAGDPPLPAPAEGAGGRELFPLHPWQASRLMLDPAIAALFDAGRIEDLGSGGPSWRATTSVRAVHSAASPWMLKFSLSVKLTNSKRIIEEHECRRGLSVHRLIKGPLGARLQQRCPSLQVLGEPAWLALRGIDGAVLPQTIVAFRENPFLGEAAPPAAVLGALCEQHPGTGESHLSDLIRRIAGAEGHAPEDAARQWFGLYLKVAVEPFAIAFSDFGLLFGAHQQNVVLGLDHGWPDKLYFRDCQGTGYVREFLPMLRAELPEAGSEGDHVFDAEPAAQLFGYYVVVNGVFAVIAALAAAGLAGEPALLGAFRRMLQDLAAQRPKNTACLDYLLRSPSLATKGNFLFSLRGINENTEVTDPLAGYVPMKNPIFEKEYA